MSKLDTVQLSSIPFNPKEMFTSFQTIGNTTTFNSPQSGGLTGIPTAIAGVAVTSNPTGIFDNTKVRATTALLMFGLVGGNNFHAAVQVIGYAKTQTTGLYLPTTFWLGEAQAGNISAAGSGEASSFLCDQFSTKTYAGFNVAYLEPADDIGAAVLLIDIRGYDYLAVELAAGASNPATKVQTWIGVN